MKLFLMSVILLTSVNSFSQSSYEGTRRSGSYDSGPGASHGRRAPVGGRLGRSLGREGQNRNSGCDSSRPPSRNPEEDFMDSCISNDQFCEMYQCSPVEENEVRSNRPSPGQVEESAE